MADWSPAIANEFIRRARADGRALTQRHLQKLVYIAHGWNLAVNGKPLTVDTPKAGDFGPVYTELWGALRDYGGEPVLREIRNSDFTFGFFDQDPQGHAVARLDAEEVAVIDRVYRVYGKFQAFQLSALTHHPGTPWTRVYGGGEGRSQDIPADMIRSYFVDLAAKTAA